MIFSKENIIFSVGILICIIGLSISISRIDHFQKYWDDKFSQVTDMNKCPQTAQYFSEFQGSFCTYPFALSAAFGAIILLLIVLFATKKFSRTTILPLDFIIFLILLVGLFTFTIVYKICSCITYRLCARGGCIRSYFSSYGSS